MSDRMVVFIDHQNVYMRARSCFHTRDDPYTSGQVDPLRLGLLLADDSPFDRELTSVRIYRGRPDSTHDPKGYGASLRQMDTWVQDPRVTDVPRTLQYPRGWPATSPPGLRPREKGVDVALAVDFVVMSIEDHDDVGIVMSLDTDLSPALEFVAARGEARAEVAAWRSRRERNRRTPLLGEGLWCHWLDQAAYDQVHDATDYTLPR